MNRFLLVCIIATYLHEGVASDCNCQEPCTRNLLEKCNSCTVGWYGPYCQKKNVALHGKASQQGNFTYLGYEHPADLAVDGDTSTSNVEALFNCSHTDERNSSWWSVQLGDNGANQIRYMKIYNREEEKQNLWRRNGMEILINGKPCKKWPHSEAPKTIENVTCANTLTGNNLTIKVIGRYYSVCEVQVFICSDGWYGEDCDKRCRCDVCDKVTGRCKLECQAGYMGDDCQTHCQDGWYGPACSSTCGHCVNKTVCDKTNGDCSWGCSDGWIGRKCDVSRDGRYGQDCSETCAQCAKKASYDETTGSLTASCEDGLGDERCDRGYSNKWHVVPMVVSAVGTCLVISLLFAGINFCLLRQGRLLWVRKSTKQPAQVSRDQVQMSDVAKQQEDLYETPTGSSSTCEATENYDVIQSDIYEAI